MCNWLKKDMEGMLKQVADPKWEKARGIFRDSSPIPYFGNYGEAKICTIGLNPSDTEFKGKPEHLCLRSNLKGKTLVDQAKEILSYYDKYFTNSSPDPDKWFKPFELFLNNFNSSYGDFYCSKNKGICVHIDLVPWATKDKWSKIKISDPLVQAVLLHDNASTFEKLLRIEKFKIIFLDGITATSEFCRMTGKLLETAPSSYATSAGNTFDVDIYHHKFQGISVVGWNRPINRMFPGASLATVTKKTKKATAIKKAIAAFAKKVALYL